MKLQAYYCLAVAVALVAACKEPEPNARSVDLTTQVRASPSQASGNRVAPSVASAQAPPAPSMGETLSASSATAAGLKKAARVALVPTTGKATSGRKGCDDCRAPSYCTARVCVEPGAVVARGKRGPNGGRMSPEQFRYQDSNESAEIAPSGLAATDADGRLFVLDQLDDQIHVYRGGEFEKVIQVPSEVSFDRIAPLRGGKLLLNDAYGSRNILYVLEQTGRVVRTFSLEGKGFEKHEQPDGLHARKDGIWARHRGEFRDGRLVSEGYMVRVSDARGNPDSERPMVTGFLSGDGRRLLGLAKSGSVLEVTSRARDDDAQRRKRTIELPGAKAKVLAYDSDRSGKLYVLVEAAEGSSVRKGTTRLFVLSRELETVHEHDLPTKPIYHEVVNPLFVSPGGFAYYLDARKDELLVRRY